MQTMRDWLADQGLAKRGARGRFSREAKDALAKALAEGIKFKDSPVSLAPKPSDSDSKESPSVVSSTNLTENFFGSTPDPRFPGVKWAGVTVKGNVRVSEKEVCRTCGYSLLYHICNTPTTIVPNCDIVPVVML